MLLLNLSLHIIADLLRCPLQWIVNSILREESQSDHLYNPKFEDYALDDVCVVLHHYAPRGLSFWKSSGNSDYLVGIGVVLNQLKDVGLSVNCFVADATEDYLLDLRRSYTEVKFFATEGMRYDFFSYIQTTSLIDTSNCKYYCMFNDNVDYQSNIELGMTFEPLLYIGSVYYVSSSSKKLYALLSY